MTISIGAATNQASDDSLDTVIQKADEAMYQAKTLGRDTYVIFEEMKNDLSSGNF